MATINRGILNSKTAYLRQLGNDWPTAQVVSTSDVIENSANLYFTTARARGAFTAGQNISIDNGTISALTTAVVVNESDIITVLEGNTAYTLSRNIADPKSILVINEGLIQIPTVDYTVSGTVLTTTTQYPVGSNIEVRYFGIDSTTSGAYTSTLSISLNSFVGNGSNVTYQLNSSPSSTAYTMVNIDGVEQLSTAYSISGSLITFTEPPANGANIDVRAFGGVVGQPYNTRNYVGDGVTVQWPITTGFTENNILVFENGIAQVPSLDYTVSPTSNVVMTTATLANVKIQIRELGQAAANLVNAIQGADIVVGNITPRVTGVYNIGSANLAYNKLYLSGSNSLILGNTTISITGSTLTLSSAGTTTVVGASASTPDIISPFMLMGA